MILELQIENLALLRQATIPLRGGLCALTGETGAGKTLILRALALLRGDRAGKEHVREGADECRVSALISLSDEKIHDLSPMLEATPVEDGELLLTRVISADGRGRCYLNDRLVPLQKLRSIASATIDILGQGESQKLMDPTHRAALLDGYGNLYEAHARWLAARERALAIRTRRDQLHRGAMERRQRIDFLRFQVEDIDAVDPQPGEWKALKDELSVLSDADALRTLTGAAIDGLYEEEDSIHDRIARWIRQGQDMKEGARELLRPAISALESAASEIDEATAQFRDAFDRVSMDKGRLEEVNERLSAIQRLLDRHGPTEEALLEQRDALKKELDSLITDDGDKETVDAALVEAENELEAVGVVLDDQRRKIGVRLAKSVESELKKLGMAKARFEVSLSPNEGSSVIDRAHASGPSTVDFMLQANPGHPPRPLHQVASGGEAARVALSLRASVSTIHDVPILVFDEIESGVGSRLGEVVARSLSSIATNRQVLVVTHLPPVAAYADHHISVRKDEREGVTESMVAVLSGKAREIEIAAMMRGSNANQKTLAEARSLLEARARDPEAVNRSAKTGPTRPAPTKPRPARPSPARPSPAKPKAAGSKRSRAGEARTAASGGTPKASGGSKRAPARGKAKPRERSAGDDTP